MFNRRSESLSSYHVLLRLFSVYFILNFARAMATSHLRGSSVVGMVKVENTGVKYSYSLVSEYQSNAYCATDSGSAGQNCKTELASGELQTTDFSNQYGSATYTYQINGAAYNVKVAMDGSGLLDADNNIVSTFGACKAVVSFPSGYTLVSLNCDATVVVGIVKILNGGEQYTFQNWGVYQSNAFCADDAGANEQSCKASLASGEEQTTDISNADGSATYTYGINNVAYNVKVSMAESGLLDSNDKVVGTVGACTATNSYPSGYTLISINCDSDPVPTYDATVYTTGVKKRGVNLSGQEWASGTYYPTVDDANKIKMIGMNAARFTIDITTLSDSSGDIDWTTGNAKKVDDSLKMLMSNGLEEVILDAHNQLVGPQAASDWTSGKITGDQLLKFWQQAASRYNGYSNFAIGVVNEPRSISTNPSDAQTEADALFAIYASIVKWFSENGITARSYWEPSDWGGIANYANPVWQNFYKNLAALSSYPETMSPDGHAYGTNTNGPGGSGYGDCDPDGVNHN
ncbi:MAG: cellulase family glycosylhydrolase, partial [Pseudomonadota bacterium]